MEIDYIIIQAGGLGTRLGYLTQNRPKAIVPVNNRPIIFHMFEKYPEAKFIIIGDYKCDVLQSYLETFAEVRYMLVQTGGMGNACGVKTALDYIPSGAPFMLVWSDLILDLNFNTDELAGGCYLGTTNRFRCSWKYQNGQLEKISTDRDGVAGLFLFDDKERLHGIPDSGSFTQWLRCSGIELKKIDLLNSHEAGTFEAVKSIDHSSDNRCRPYNKMTFEKSRVIKEGLTKEGNDLIEREILWYEKVADCGFDAIPHIYSLKPLIMERITGENIFKASLTYEQKKGTLDKLIEKLDCLHKLKPSPPNVFDMQEDYYTKTLKRLYSIRNVIPYNNSEHIVINGINCKNIFFYKDVFQNMVNDIIRHPAEFGLIHGDGTLTNTMIDGSGNIYFIDARGYFGKTPLVGDVYYDWAKLYYSISGAFDQFNIKNFSLQITDTEIKYTIAPSGWEQLTGYFMDKIPNCDEYRIKFIHAVIWLSLASHCWEDYDSMCLAFYNGIYLWNELIQE